MDSIIALFLLANVGASLAIVPRTAEEKMSAELPAEARSDTDAEQSSFGYDFPPLANYYAAAYNHLPSEKETRSYFGYPLSNYYSSIYNEYFPHLYRPLGYYYPGHVGIFGPIPYPYGFYQTSYDTPLTAIDDLDLYRANVRVDPVVVPPADPAKSSIASS